MIAEYKIKINTQDIERAQKVIHQTGGELQKLSQDEVVVKLKYDENKKEINQIIQKLYKTSPKLAVQVEYEMNKEALEKQRKKLNNMALTVDDSALINRIESLSKKYSTMLSNDAPQEQIDKLEKRLADLFATLFEKANGDYNILQKLSEEARNLYEDIPNLADGKSLSIISPEQYEKQANILESLKKKRDDLFKSGAVDSSIDKTTASMEDLMDVFSKFAVLNNNTNLSSFWDDLQTKVANGDNNLKSILSTLGLITDEAEELKLVSDGMVKSGGIIGEDNVLLATKGGKEKGRLADTLELQKRLIAAKEAGVEVARILSVVYDEASDTFLELQEKAPGNILGSIYGQNDEDFVNLDLYKSTDQQILKLIQDLAKLQELGLGVDINTSNIFYDKTKGFSFIDLDLNPAAYESNIEFIEDAKMGIIGAIEEYYEIVGDSVGTQRIQELSQKFDKFFNAIIDQLGGESAFDSSAIQTVLTNLQVVGEQAGEAIIDGLRAGVDAHSNSKKAESVVDDVANGIVDEFEARTDDMQKAAQKSADAIAESFGERLKSGFDELDEVYSSLQDTNNVKKYTDAEQASEAVRNVSNETTVLFQESDGQLSMFENIANAKREDAKATEELIDAEKRLSNIPGQMSIFDFINKETDAKLDNVKATEAETVSIKEQIDKIKELGLSANDTENAIKLLQGGSSGFNWVDYEDHAKDYVQQIQQLIQLLKSFGLQVKSEENSDAFRTDIKTTTKLQERNKLVSAYIGLLKEEIKYEAELEVLQSRSGDQSSAIAVVENNLEAIREEKQLYSDLQLTKEEDLRKTNVLEKAKREASAKAAKALQDEAKQTEALMKKRTSLAQSMIRWLSSNPIAEKKYGPSLREDIDELNSSASLTSERINQIEDGFKRVKTAAIEAGETGKSLMNMFHQRFKSLITYLGTFVSFYRIIGTARSAITTIIELDTQLVDLRKTTKMNNEELERFYKNSSDIAKQLGVTTSEIISQAAAWSRFNKIDPLYGNI